jgi:hypothetical protein
MIERAKALVKEYIGKHIDNTNAQPTIFVVWQSQVLQHFKCMIATTLPLGMCFQLTYDGDLKQWYFDVYRKTDHREIVEVSNGLQQQSD